MRTLTKEQIENEEIETDETEKCDCCGKKFEASKKSAILLIALEDVETALAFDFCSIKCKNKQSPIIKQNINKKFGLDYEQQEEFILK